MKILIAADKFKGSLTSSEACDAIEKGFLEASPRYNTKKLPLSDGGDGILDVISCYKKVTKHSVNVLDPLFRPVKAHYLLSLDDKTAFIEMAQASGLLLLHPDEYNCMHTTTYGTGQLLKEVIKNGVEKIILGIGGSATNDAGIGMAAALGYKFLDKNRKELKPVGKNLINIHTINAENKIPVNGVTIQVACDVTNYLTGENGATKTYAPQKGAAPQLVEQLEEGMINFANVVKKDMGIDVNELKGGGAAGGMGAGCFIFLNASLISGVNLILKYADAEKNIIEADVIITGEGKIDEQTLNGKLVYGISHLCLKYEKPLIALCGTLDITMSQLQQMGLNAAFSIINSPMSIEAARDQTAALLTQAACNLGNLFNSVSFLPSIK